jgi:hypothetical protein
MIQEIELDLVAGGSLKLTLPEPGDFASFYVFSMECSGSFSFWKLLERLMAAAGRPLCNFQTMRRQAGEARESLKLTSAAQQILLRRSGYGFGTFYDVLAPLREVFAGASVKLLFLRDPRDMLMARYHQLKKQSRERAGIESHGAAQEEVPGGPAEFAEFLQSPEVEAVAQRYRRLAELRDREPNVTLLRYEQALTDWHATAADVRAALNLPIGWLTTSSLAAGASPIGDRLPAQIRAVDGVWPTGGAEPNWQKIAEIEARFADVMAAFGYAPRPRPGSQAPSAQSLQSPPQTPVSGSDAPASAKDERRGPAPGAIYEPDPVLFTRLKPNTYTEMMVLGRKVIMDVDATGCRPVTGQPAVGEKTLAVFGCSFTYGTAIAAEETFCSLLQGMFPNWRVENHGVSAYCTTSNLVQLERVTKWNQPQLVTFCWIGQHLQRNVADISWIQLMSENMLGGATPKEVPTQRFPRAALNSDGMLQMRSVRVPRKELLGIDFSDFTVDLYYADQVCFRLFERANAIVTGYGGHFFITTLRGHFSPVLAAQLADVGIPVVDARLHGAEYTCLPDDGHPNALANRIFAEKIHDYLQRYIGERPVANAVGLSAIA